MSSCVRNSSVTISLLGDSSPIIEFLPQSLSWSTEKRKFDSARATTGSQVRNAIKPHTQNGDGQTIFDRPVPAVFKINGKDAKFMVLYPDGIRISRDSMSLEFRDPLKYLKNGDVNISYNGQSFKDIYKTAFEAVDSSDTVFSGLEFNMESLGDATVTDSLHGNIMGAVIEQQQHELQNNKKLIVSSENLEFNHAKPIEVFNSLNSELGLESWVTTDGTLKIGNRETSGKPYITAPDDIRVLYMVDYNISAPRTPIKKVVVRGSVVDEPSDGPLKNGTEFLDPRRGHENEFRAEGYAVNTEVNFGEVKTISKDVGSAGAEALAVSKIIELQRKQWDGSISINPEKSGTAVNDVRDVQIGDVIATIPPDEVNDGCWSSVWIDKYIVSGVNHDFSGSYWTLDLDVYPIGDGYLSLSNLDSGTRYFNREAKKYMSGEAYRNRNKNSGILSDLSDVGEWGADLGEELTDPLEDGYEELDETIGGTDDDGYLSENADELIDEFTP